MPLRLKHIAIPSLALALNACSSQGVQPPTTDAAQDSDNTPTTEVIENKELLDGCSVIKAPENTDDAWLIKKDTIVCPDFHFPQN